MSLWVSYEKQIGSDIVDMVAHFKDELFNNS